MIKNIDPVLDARNIIYGLAFIAFLPLLMLIMMCFLDSGIKWDGVTFGIIGYFLSLSGLSVYAAVLCGKKKKLGRIIACIASVPLLVFFPLGTFFAVATLIKVNKSEFVNVLN